MANSFNYTARTMNSGRRVYSFTLSTTGVKYIFAYTDGEATMIAARVAADLSETVTVAPALITAYCISTADSKLSDD